MVKSSGVIQIHFNIIMRPVRDNVGNDYFSDLILADLIKEGVSRDALLTKFRERTMELHSAIKNMFAESTEAARNFHGTAETEEIFGDNTED
ncbi:hypothetical protein [Cohnella soli]|uniref:Uncharacterized protein n=1 Tax=Cohnella soli TaxID=425005 RepID=A0ABW0HNL5_9BACL